jgi:hypothetical protein
MNSYGKTWHTWMTGLYGREGDSLPIGPPELQWSFNRDGEELAGMVEARDRRMRLNTAEAREHRRDLQKETAAKAARTMDTIFERQGLK